MAKLRKTPLRRDELLHRIAQQENILNQITIRCCAVEYENHRLKSLLYKSLHAPIDAADIEQYDLAPMIAEKAAKELSRPLRTIAFPTRMQNIFSSLGMKTLKDLLSEIKYNKMKRVIEHRTVGKKLVGETLRALQKEGISDMYNRCYLFKYV